MIEAKVVQATEIVLSPVPDRFECKIPKGSEDNLDQIPIEVIKSRESEKYIVIRGRDIFMTGKGCGIEKFTCHIIDEVPTDIEAAIVRLRHVFSPGRPFTVLEEANGIHYWIKNISLNHQVYENGGDRRSKNYNKEKVDMHLEKIFPHMQPRIAILRRFSEKVGSIGLEGLHHILEEEGEMLNISRVNKNNGKAQLKTVKQEISKMKQEGINDDDIKRRIGLLVYRTLFEENFYDEARPNGGKGTDTPDSDLDDQDDNPDMVNPHPEEDPPPINPDIPLVNENRLAKIRKSHDKHFRVQEKIKAYMKSKVNLNQAEADKIQRLINVMQTTFTEFIKNFYRTMSNQ